MIASPQHPDHQEGEGTRLAFLHLFAFVTLGIWAISLSSLFATLLDLWIPPTKSAETYWLTITLSHYHTTFAWEISAILIALPCFLWTNFLSARDLRKQPERTKSGVRVLLIYILLFISALIIISEWVYFLYAIIAGEITYNETLKNFVVLLMAASIFAYYFFSIKFGDDTFAEARDQFFAAIAVASASAGIVLAVISMHTRSLPAQSITQPLQYPASVNTQKTQVYNTSPTIPTNDAVVQLLNTHADLKNHHLAIVGFKIRSGDVIDGITPLFSEIQPHAELGNTIKGQAECGADGGETVALHPGYVVTGLDIRRGYYFGDSAVAQVRIFWNKLTPQGIDHNASIISDVLGSGKYATMDREPTSFRAEGNNYLTNLWSSCSIHSSGEIYLKSMALSLSGELEQARTSFYNPPPVTWESPPPKKSGFWNLLGMPSGWSEFGGPPYCRYATRMTLRNLNLPQYDLARQKSRILLRASFAESAFNCPYPPLPANDKDFDAISVNTDNNIINISFQEHGKGSNGLQAELHATYSTHHVLQGIVAFERTDLGPPLSWVIPVAVRLEK